MKIIYILRYNSYGDELCGKLFSTMKKLQKRIDYLVNRYKWNRDKFDIEEVEIN